MNRPSLSRQVGAKQVVLVPALWREIEPHLAVWTRCVEHLNKPGTNQFRHDGIQWLWCQCRGTLVVLMYPRQPVQDLEPCVEFLLGRFVLFHVNTFLVALDCCEQ